MRLVAGHAATMRHSGAVCKRPVRHTAALGNWTEGLIVRVLIIDDHALVREGVAAVIKAALPQTEIVQADSCHAGLQAVATARCDMALLDLQLPDQPGFYALELFRKMYPDMPVVVVSAMEDRDTVMRALDAGAKAFVPKSASSERIRSALLALLDGRVYVPDALFAGAPGAPPSSGSQETGPWNLTSRQLEVLALLVAGLPNKLIARRLNIAESTVKIHVSAILRQLRVTSRTQALIAVAKFGVRLPQL